MTLGQQQSITANDMENQKFKDQIYNSSERSNHILEPSWLLLADRHVPLLCSPVLYIVLKQKHRFLPRSQMLPHESSPPR